MDPTFLFDYQCKSQKWHPGLATRNSVNRFRSQMEQRLWQTLLERYMRTRSEATTGSLNPMRLCGCMRRIRVFLLISALKIIGNLRGNEFVILESSKMDFRGDSEVSNGGGRLQLGVTGGKARSTGNHGGPGIHLANARIIEPHHWTGCNTNWYYHKS